MNSNAPGPSRPLSAPRSESGKDAAKILVPLAVAVVLALGIFVRFYQFDRHFAHFDDVGPPMLIMEMKNAGKPYLFCVSRAFTYAPVQYLLTSALLHSYSYHELLFRGRLPSVLAGILGLFALLVFYRLFRPEKSFARLTALALLAFSWENIIYSRHGSNYALGVPAHLFLLCILLWRIRTGPSWKNVGLSSAAAAFLSACHYEIMFLVPAFFAVILADRIAKEKGPWAVLRQEAAGGLIYAALVLPMAAAFLFHRTEAGVVEWNKGPNGEFLFTLPAEPIAAKIAYLFHFVTVNSWLVFQSMLSMVPEEHPFLQGITAVLAVLFAAGIFRLAREKNPESRALSLYLAVTAAVWGALIVTRHLTWSPTRHMLILLPLFAVGIAEGLDYLAVRVFRDRQARPAAHAAFSVLCAALFFLSFQQVLARRYDPVDEDRIYGVVEKYAPDFLFAIGPLKTLPRVNAYFRQGRSSSGRNFYRVVWLSRTDRLSEQKIKEMAAYLASQGLLPRDPGLGFRLAYSEEKVFGPEYEFSTRTVADKNTFYFNIIDYYMRDAAGAPES